jgi:hypothetical protein
MTVSDLQVLHEGDEVTSNGVSFRFSESIPDLMASTTSETPGFAWSWMVFSKVFARADGSTLSFDAGVLCAVHAGRLHCLVLPMDGAYFSYQDAALDELELTPDIARSLFGKVKLRKVGVQLSAELAFAAERVDLLTDGRPGRSDHLAGFGAALGVTVGPS